MGDGVGVGVAFTKTDTGTRTLLDAHDIVINEPSRVLIMVPASLAAGTYDLSLTTQFTGSNNPEKSSDSGFQNENHDRLTVNVAVKSDFTKR